MTTLDRLRDLLVDGRCGDPFALLGPHQHDDQIVVRAFAPDADGIQVLNDQATPIAQLASTQRSGLFEAPVPLENVSTGYRLRIHRGDEYEDTADPYWFGPQLGEQDVWFLAEGTHRRPWTVLGAHPRRLHDVDGTNFAVWAPNANSVNVIGDFNNWDRRRHPMRHRPECGVWELFVPGVKPGARYKFAIHDADDTLLPNKADPFAFHAEQRPRTASVVTDLPAPPRPLGRVSSDPQAPLSIYELHAGSWRRDPEQPERFLSWRELADALVPYVQRMGFTHVELLPISEHPFDGSWGYQPTALYAPSSRHGTAVDFAAFVDRLHAAGIGVILDWVPAHFPSDEHGLARFDGTCLYEHADPRQGRHPDWGTLIYNLGRREVTNYLVANAMYWLEVFGVDGLRVDAVASMLYLDYSRAPGEWLPNRYGGRENLDAVSFLQQVSTMVRDRHPHAVIIAEESTAWPQVTRRAEEGGLGFHYKWNMGWMNDTLRYLERDSAHRPFHHNEFTFSFMYAFSEAFLLPLSHDEVVHGKRSLLEKIPGDEWQRFATLRAYFAFMYAHPGKKLLFMGGEFAQRNEWNHDRSLDWHLLEQPLHQQTQELIARLNHLYRDKPALCSGDADRGGFAWINGEDNEHCVIAFTRQSLDGEHLIAAVSHFTPVPQHDYRIGVPRAGRYALLLNTDADDFGGSNVVKATHYDSSAIPMHGFEHSLSMTLPPLATVYLEWLT